MRKGKSIWVLVVLVLAVVILSVFLIFIIPKNKNGNENNGAGLANPASVNCIDKGYEFEIRTNQDGSQYGVCMFPDGSECEEWAYYRGECEIGDSLI